MNKNEQLYDLEDRLEKSESEVSRLMEEVETYKQAISAYPAVKQEYDAQIVQIKAEHDKEMAMMKDLLKATEISVNRKVADVLTSMGVNAFAPEEIALNDNSPSAIYQKFLSLRGTEQTAFYNKHQKVISDFLNAK